MFRLLPIFLLFPLLLLSSADYEYSLRWGPPNAHTYLVSLEVDAEGEDMDFAIPAWRPGRYRLQNFSAAVSEFSATNEKGAALIWHKVSKDIWRVKTNGGGKVRITYQFYANNTDAGSSYVGENEAYFNPVNMFMYMPGNLEGSVTLMVPELPSDWGVATALTRKGNTFTADSYHEFVDSPVVFARKIKTLNFTDDGVKFYIHLQGEYNGGKATDDAILESLTKICREQKAIFGGYPMTEYHFIYRLLPYRIRHGVEHANSVMMAVPMVNFESPKAFSSLTGLSAHEFFHVWNVKRIRPATLYPYDYSQPQYTTLHWLTEGITDYYANLSLIRSGLIDEDQFLRKLASTIQSLENDYAASIVSPSESSFNSWLEESPYRDPFRQVSYYGLGNRLGWILDLTVREKTNGAVTLDAVMNYLYQEYYLQDRGVPENGVQLALERLTRDSWQEFFDDYVHGTKPFPYEKILAPFGLEIERETEKNAGKKSLGILRTENIRQGLLVRSLHPGGDAWKAGLGEGDLILEIDGKNAAETDVDEYVNKLKPGVKVSLNVYREFQVREIIVKYDQNFSPETFRLTRKSKLKKKEEGLYQDWLQTKVE